VGDTRLNFDLVIVGGGPAGLAAALAASKESSNVMIVEKKGTFGGPVTCGEFVPSEVEVKRLLPQASGLDEFYKFVTSITVMNRTRLIRLYTPSMSGYEFKFDGIVLNKPRFHAELAKEAERRGVTTRASTNVTRLEERDHGVEIFASFQGVPRTVRTRIVIGADGFPSIIARNAELKTEYAATDSALCFNALMENVDSDMDTVEMYVGNKLAPGGYAWIIPKGNGVANVGLGMRLSRIDRSHVFHEYVRRFLEGPEMKSRLSEARTISKSFKIVPVGGLVKEIFTSRILLAGDAAGAVIPINGSGIPTALVSGSIAGICASRSLIDIYSVRNYPFLLKRQLFMPIRKGLKYRRIADLAMKYDLAFNILVRLMGSSMVERTLRNEGFL